MYSQQFQLLCKVLHITPEDLIQDFINNISCGSWKRQGRDEAKAHLLEYFIAQGYGRQQYSQEEVRELFKELDALGLLFPVGGTNEAISQYSKWRKEYHRYLLKKWKREPKKKIKNPSSIIE